MFAQLAQLRPYQRAIAGIVSVLCLLTLIVAVFVPTGFPPGWPMRFDLFGTAFLGLSLALNPALYNREPSEHPFRNAPAICKVLMAMAVGAIAISLILYLW